MSSIVARVRVRAADAARWNTVDGSEPQNRYRTSGTPLSTDPSYHIYTPLHAAVSEVLFGQNPGAQITLHQIGGVVGDVLTETRPSPNLRVGDEAVAFLIQAPMNMGTWTINEAYVVDGHQASSSMTHKTLSLQELLDEISAAASAMAR